jgi:MFS family permease
VTDVQQPVDASGDDHGAPIDGSKKKKVELGLNYWKLWTASVGSNLGDGVAAIAYPWLASAITRDPILIALIAVAQRIPWLIFTLPAGVITDRVDRRKAMVWMDVLRAALTLVVAFAVLGATSGLPTVEAIAEGVPISTNQLLYWLLVLTAFLLGMAEVLRDNASQTILPAIVKPEALETANGRMWGAEMVMNSFLGPVVGSLLIVVAFALPFFFDAVTFALAAVLVFLMTGDFRSPSAESQSGKVQWRAEIAEGFGWLWRHDLLRPMAIILGIMNAVAAMAFATFVLFAQEVLDVNAFVFAVLGTGGAVGGIVGSVTAPKISERLGSGPSLYVTLIGGGLTSLIVGLSTHWVVAWVMFTAFTFTAVLWNVITVSLRQTIIPDRLLGRVNSVYRFFAWGMMPIGMLIGGLLVAGAEQVVSRDVALRLPWLAGAIIYAVLFVYAAPRLTTEKLEGARAEGMAAREALAKEQDESEALTTEGSDE